jgi:DNA-binding protein Fis
MKKNNLLEESVRLSLEQYLSDLGDSDPNDMYDMVRSPWRGLNRTNQKPPSCWA